jgi:hypothetical protein
MNWKGSTRTPIVFSRSAMQMPGETERNYEKLQCLRFEYQSEALRVTRHRRVSKSYFLATARHEFLRMFNYVVSQKFSL